MPPCRRPKSQQPAPESSPSPLPETDSVVSASDRDSASDSGDDSLSFFQTSFNTFRVSPLYVGRNQLGRARLGVLARRLRDALVGDVVRGVEVGLAAAGDDGGDDDSGAGVLARMGALQRVEMRWVGVDSLLGVPLPNRGGGDGRARADGDTDLGSDALDPGQQRQGRHGWHGEEEGWGGWESRIRTLKRRGRRALRISLLYEKTVCGALLLPQLGTEAEEGGDEEEDHDARHSKGAARTQFFVGEAEKLSHSTTIEAAAADPGTSQFVRLPLLLLRTPAALKGVMTEFLSTTFDCRVHPLRLGTRTIVRSWEAWAAAVGLPPHGPLASDVTLSLGVHMPPPPPPPLQAAEGELLPPATDAEDAAGVGISGGGGGGVGLKSIDIFIPAEELRRFLDAGKRLSPASRYGNLDHVDGGTRRAEFWEDHVAKRRRLAGRLFEEGWEWRGGSATAPTVGRRVGVDEDATRTAASATTTTFEQPFTEALGRYLDEHLGLNLFHPSVRITKIGCAGFTVSESRLKMHPAVERARGKKRTRGGEGREADGEGQDGEFGRIGAVVDLLSDLVQKASMTEMIS